VKPTNNHMKIQHLLLTICIIPCLLSCDKIGFGASTPDTTICTLLTGECLASTQLSYIVPTDDEQVRENRFLFSFGVEFTNHSKEKILTRHWRDIPSDELFSTFGSNKQTVKHEYEGIYREVTNSYVSCIGWPEKYSIITILYNGGISLTCESDFAGHAAGGNLASFITCYPVYDSFVEQSGENPIISHFFNTPSNVGKCIEMPMDYISMIGGTIRFSIPMGDYELLHTGANFRLEIPVRVVDYLTWLNNKISDPNAEMPYRDEVLKCSFRTNWTVR